MFGKQKKILIILFVLVLLIASVVLYFKKFGSPGKLVEKVFGPSVVEQEDRGVQTKLGQPKVFVKIPEIVDDADNDGISDTREKELGTSNETYDSDGDLLSDRLEVDMYKTDPLNPDTDGDGFWDGSEVAKGYNPLGEGVLE